MSRMIPRRFTAPVLAAAAVLAAFALHASAAAPAEDVVVIKARRIITASGDDISNGEIVIIDGKIRLVGKNLEYPKGARIIDAPTETVMPGMIHLRTRNGLDRHSRSGVNADFNVADELYLSEIDLEDFLRAGFTAVTFYPDGVGFPGSASVYRTAGPEDERLLTRSAYLRVTMSSQPRDKRTIRDALARAKAEIDKVEKARQEWEKKKAEADAKKKAEEAKKQAEPQQPPQPQGPPVPQPPAPPPPAPAPAPLGPPADELAEFKPPPIDPKHAPIVDWLQKKPDVRCLFELTRSSDVVHLYDALDEKQMELPRVLMLINQFNSDYHYITAALGSRKELVITTPQVSTVSNTIIEYNLTAELYLAGCEVALVPQFDSRDELESYRTRLAALTRAGLTRTNALRSITLNPAKAVGLNSRLGSIEKDKDADLVFLDADALDPLSKVTRVMILGQIVYTNED